jgi:hypothetical protein
MDSSGCLSYRDSVGIYVDNTLMPALQVSNADSACLGDSAFAIASAGAANINWYEDASGTRLLANGTNLAIADISESGYYFVQSSNQYCESPMDSVHLQIMALPDADYTYSVDAGNISLNAKTKQSHRTYEWLFPDGKKQGATSNWTALNDGTYDISLVVYDSTTGCKDTSTQNIEIIGLAVWPLSNPQDLRVYPMPNRGSFFFNLIGADAGGEYILYDLNGKSLVIGRVEKNGTTYVQHQLAPGIYNLVVMQNGHRWVQQVAVF